MPDRWAFHVSAYYGEGAKPPKEPGALAFVTGCVDRTTADIEALVARGRPDIGAVYIDEA